MNFIEALKANETEEVMIVGDLRIINVGSLKYSRIPVGDIMSKTFKIHKKPRVVEFECNWECEYNIYSIRGVNRDYAFKLESLNNGKRWSVRCEEIL